MNWQVYIVLCSDDTLYTGITTDIERRMRQHATGRGAKYFRGRQLKELVYLEGGHDRSSASRRELSIKAMKRAEKERLLKLQTVIPEAILIGDPVSKRRSSGSPMQALGDDSLIAGDQHVHFLANRQQ